MEHSMEHSIEHLMEHSTALPQGTVICRVSIILITNGHQCKSYFDLCRIESTTGHSRVHYGTYSSPLWDTRQSMSKDIDHAVDHSE